MGVVRVWSAIGMLSSHTAAATTFANWLESFPRDRVAEALVHMWFLWHRRCFLAFDDVREPWQLVLRRASEVLHLLRGGQALRPLLVAREGGLC